MPHRSAAAKVLPIALACAACIEAPEPAALGTPLRSVELTARDASGQPVSPQALPRRPTLELYHPDGFDAAEDAIALYAGPKDAALVEDLARVPLGAAQRARLVDCLIELAGTRARITPRVALAEGGRYALAIAAWARSARGGRFDEPGTPIVFELRAAEGASAGARPIASWPADGASGLGTNLEAAVVVFDGEVHGAAEGVWLEGPDGLAVPAEIDFGPCPRVAPPHAGSFCVRLAPRARLAPAARHRIVIGGAARDGRGAPVGPWQATFRTAGSRDLRAPALLETACALDEQPVAAGCALASDTKLALRGLADEAVIATLELATAQTTAVAPDGRFELLVTGLEPDTSYPVQLALRDAAGNAERFAFALRTHPPLATLAIVEVLANPLGPEPQQEFVELLNYGAHPLELLGVSLADRPDREGQAIEIAARVEPRARALLVADGFDPGDGRDAAPPPGALLVRMGPSLASAGLRNAGEPLYLRDALGRRISAAPATPRPRSGVCLVRVADDPRSGAPEDFAQTPDCTPGFSL